MHKFGDAQTRPIGHAERGLAFEPGRRTQQARHLRGAQDHRQLARLAHKLGVVTMSLRPTVTLTRCGSWHV